MIDDTPSPVTLGTTHTGVISMSDQLAQLGVLLVLGLLAVITIGSAVASIVADSRWWVIARGETRGTYQRVRRTLIGGHRG